MKDDMLRDKDIREPLFEYLDEQYGKNRIIEEKQIGKSRADVMMVTEDALWGIEIKSDADTFVRLERQVKDYNRFFDYNMVVVGSTHAMHVAEHLPEYWGILSVEKIGELFDFYVVREPVRNPKREKAVLFRNQVSFLWRPELAHIQEINELPKYNYLGKDKLIRKMIEKLPQERLKKQVCEELMERDYNTIKERIDNYKEKKNETGL